MKQMDLHFKLFYQDLFAIEWFSSSTLVKPAVIVIGAIPVIFAILIAIPLLTQTEIPITASVPSDKITIEYTKHQLTTTSSGVVAERTAVQSTEILLIKDDGNVRYTKVNEGITQPDKSYYIDDEKLKKLTALIKETGFMQIPTESFPLKERIDAYNKSTLKVTLNNQIKQIHWPDQNATDKFVPPIFTLFQSELDEIIQKIHYDIENRID